MRVRLGSDHCGTCRWQVVDDLRTDIAGLFGKQFMHTPNIDALAASGLGFKSAFVQQALCGPSRASFLTGRRPETTRIVKW